jgi:hypothetical protein
MCSTQLCMTSLNRRPICEELQLLELVAGERTAEDFPCMNCDSSCHE